MKRAARFLLSLILLTGYLQAKSNSTKGTEFWFGYMDNMRLDYNSRPAFSIILSSEFDADVSIKINNNSFNEIKIKLKPNESEEVFLPINDKSQRPEEKTIYYPLTSEKIEYWGISIKSNYPISVYAMHYRIHFTDATIVLPLQELGRDYNILAGRDYKYCKMYPNGNPDASEFLLVGVDDSTKIEIIPSVITRNLRPAKQPFEITLNRGEVYQVKSTYRAFEPFDLQNPGLKDEPDLTATIVRGLNNLNFAVFSGAKQAATLPDYPDNHLWDQDYPVELWGCDYFYIPFKKQKGDIVKILAAENSTIIYLDCEKDTILNKGGYCTRLFSEPVYISSNKKISIAQIQKPCYVTGYKYGDPSMLILPPINLMAKKAIFKIPNYAGSLPLVQFFEHYTNIITRTNDILNLKLDGNSIESQFQAIPSAPGYSYAQIELTGENHTIECGGGFYAYSYGYGMADSYTFHLGYDYRDDFFRGKVIFPDTTASLTEFNIKIPIYFNMQSNSKSRKIKDLTITLHFDNRSFYFKGLTKGTFTSTTEDTITYLTIELNDIEIRDSLEVLTYVIGDLLYSEANYTDFVIDEIKTSDPMMMICRKNMKENGSVSGIGCTPFYFGLQKNKGNNLTILENPVSDELNAEIETYEQGKVECLVYDITGRLIQSDNWIASPGNGMLQKYNFDFNLKGIANGIYLVVIKTPQEEIAKSFVKLGR